MTAPSGRRSRLRPEHVVITGAALAWVALVLPAAAGVGHAHEVGGASPGAIIGGWTVMVVAMMLPPALPLVRSLVALDDGRLRLPMAGIGAVVAVWLATGAVLFGLAAGLSGLIDLAPTGRTRDVAIGAALMVAGGYQFTPLRAACLTACRTPRWFVLRYWHGYSALRETLRIGAAYGVACVGCCWALMVVCVVGGAAALPSMVAFTALMAVERLTRRGRRTARAAGWALLVAGACAVLGVLPDPFAVLLLGTH
jgi:predicted metal-binding membrane protein